MNGIQKGQRKVGRPLCEDWAYASRLCDGLNITDPHKRQAKMKSLYRMVMNLGGAKRLNALDESTRNVLMKFYPSPNTFNPQRPSLKSIGLPDSNRKLRNLEMYAEGSLRAYGLEPISHG